MGYNATIYNDGDKESKIRIDIYFSKLSALQPGRLVGNHLGVYHLGNVTVDRIKGQGRRIVLLSDDFAVRNQTELN